MDGESFYITLPSNASMARFPQNHGGDYRVDLPVEIQVNSLNWEVALSDIIFNQDWPTVLSGDIWVQACINDETGGGWQNACAYETLTKQEANWHYSDEKEFIDKALKPLIERALASAKLTHGNIDLSLDKDGRFKFALPAVIHESKRPVRIEFSTCLLHVLGFSGKSQLIDGRYFQSDTETGAIISELSHFACSLKRAISSLWIYTDIIRPHIVGHSLSPLLRVVAVDSNIKNDACRVIEFQKPYYFPLNTGNIQSVHVRIFNTGGQTPVLFASPVICKLHFRRIKAWSSITQPGSI